MRQPTLDCKEPDNFWDLKYLEPENEVQYPMPYNTFFELQCKKGFKPIRNISNVLVTCTAGIQIDDYDYRFINPNLSHTFNGSLCKPGIYVH